jgi:hypothetical protein
VNELRQDAEQFLPGVFVEATGVEDQKSLKQFYRRFRQNLHDAVEVSMVENFLRAPWPSFYRHDAAFC